MFIGYEGFESITIKTKGYGNSPAWQLEQQAESSHLKPQAGSQEQTGNDT